MSPKAWLASLLSLLVPGLGQIYAGKSARGAVILIVVIIVGNLNAIWLSLFSISSAAGSDAFWAYALPRFLHRLFAFYGVIFWIWQVADAHKQASAPMQAST